VLGRHELSKGLWEGLDNPDNYVLSGSPEQLLIVGGFRPAVTSEATGETFTFDWGILYGVYQLLEDQGVRWFRPEPEGEEVPTRTSVSIPQGEHRYSPGFAFRWGAALYADTYLKSETKEEREMAR